MTIENSSISGNNGTAGDGGVDGPFLTGPKLVTLRGTILWERPPFAPPAFPGTRLWRQPVDYFARSQLDWQVPQLTPVNLISVVIRCSAIWLTAEPGTRISHCCPEAPPSMPVTIPYVRRRISWACAARRMATATWYTAVTSARARVLPGE